VNAINGLIFGGAFEEAEKLVEQLLASEPESPQAWGLLSLLRQKQVRPDEAVVALRHSLRLHPDPAAHSNLLHIRQYDNDVRADALLLAHREWNNSYAVSAAPYPPHARVRETAARPLRLGFVSFQFFKHPISFLALGPLECLDKQRCCVTCYADHWTADEY